MKEDVEEALEDLTANLKEVYLKKKKMSWTNNLIGKVSQGDVKDIEILYQKCSFDYDSWSADIHL